jgi:ABC-type antimicrobial peptide transport system permease subunit
MGVAIRTTGPPAAIAPAVRALVRAIDPKLPLTAMRDMQTIVAASLARERLTMGLLGAAAALAVLVGVVGLYATIAYSLAQRRREFGVRIALGATAGHLRAVVARDAAATVGAGLAVGAAVAWAGSGLLGQLLYGIQPLDMPSWVGAGLGLAAIAAIAVALSLRALRALRPLDALRVQ